MAGTNNRDRTGAPRRAPRAALGVALLLALASSAPAGAGGGGEWDWGFLASRQRDLDGGMRLRFLGPLVEFRQGPEGESLRAIRPLFASEGNPGDASLYRDFLWPVGSDRILGTDRSWRALTAYGHWFETDRPGGRYRVWVLPVYFQGRDAQGRPYAALFPLGGRIADIFFQDRVEFALFPLWARTRQAQEELRSVHVLWPLYGETRGKGIYRIRVFPFYGRNTHRTLYEKRFVLWPLWTDARYHHPQASGYGYILWPLWSRIELADQSAWMIAPPLVRRTRAQQLDAFSVWPVFHWSRGRVERLSVWPLAGRTRRAGAESSFLLWPLGRRERVDRGDAVLRLDAINPVFLHSRIVGREDAGPARERHVRLWPLGSYDRTGDRSRLRIPDLWPTRSARPVERSWAPLWTLFERNARDDARSVELLWGLFRRQSRGGEWSRTSVFPLVEWESGAGPGGPLRRWSLLKGLAGVRTTPGGTERRLLYLLRWRTPAEMEAAP